jgi:hypothetical protein
LRHRIVRRADLDEETRARMFELMQLCYDNIDRARFFADLDAKRDVIALIDDHRPEGLRHQLMGFSTVRIARERLRGRDVDILFSGDTVIHPDCWGAKALQSGFLAYTVKHKLRRPWRPLYWLLLSKGYKTYLLLANNFPTAFPRRDTAPDRIAPAHDLVQLRDRLASSWWPNEFDAASGIVRFARDRVKNGVAPIDPETLAHPDVAFFVENNPRWADGDELVCFAEIDFALGVRWFAKQARRTFGGSRTLAPANAAARSSSQHGEQFASQTREAAAGGEAPPIPAAP